MFLEIVNQYQIKALKTGREKKHDVKEYIFFIMLLACALCLVVTSFLGYTGAMIASDILMIIFAIVFWMYDQKNNSDRNCADKINPKLLARLKVLEEILKAHNFWSVDGLRWLEERCVEKDKDSNNRLNICTIFSIIIIPVAAIMGGALNFDSDVPVEIQVVLITSVVVTILILGGVVIWCKEIFQAIKSLFLPDYRQIADDIASLRIMYFSQEDDIVIG